LQSVRQWEWEGDESELQGVNLKRRGHIFMPTQPIVGLHHVTAIASDPQVNLDFYTEVLGLRFVKRTVNFDDPWTCGGGGC
jgi:hypothetical protein